MMIKKFLFAHHLSLQQERHQAEDEKKLQRNYQQKWDEETL